MKRCLNSRSMWFGAVACVVVLATLASERAVTNTAVPPPMELVTEEVRREALNAPTVDDGSGRRQEGILLMTVSPQFITGKIRALDQDAELIQDHLWEKIGVRTIVVRTRDSRLDRLVQELQGTPGVIAVGKNWVRSTLDIALMARNRPTHCKSRSPCLADS